MWLAPYHHERLFTALSPAAVYARIAQRVPEIPPPPHDDDEPWYGGEASEAAFCLQRLIRYRNSFLPKLLGR